MHVKYFQALADIQRHYDDILHNLEIVNTSKFGITVLESWGISLEEKDLIQEEREVLNYLLSCQGMLAFRKNTTKPAIEAVNRCFNRYLFFLENIFQCHEKNANQYPGQLPTT